MGSEEQKPTPENGTLFQGFEWNVPDDHKHWKRLAEQLAISNTQENYRHRRSFCSPTTNINKILPVSKPTYPTIRANYLRSPKLKAIGINNIWLPPGCKAANPKGVGYDIYDLYDLGEFDQKGAKGTKWGTKEELIELTKVAKKNGVGLYWDAVLNHKAGADNTEKCRVVEVDQNNRTKEVSEAYEIEGWLGFDFPGRGEQYSKMKYHWEHFSGTDYNQANEKKAIYKILGDNKGWSSTVDDEQGNADYMMFADIDYSHPDVQEDVKNWGVWITKELGIKGFRLDAVQHFSERFTNDWINNLREQCGHDIFVVGEFWSGDVKEMSDWLDDMEHKFALYDSPLLNNFGQISTTESGDLRKVFDNTLVNLRPTDAVTVVTNHDTQPGQVMETKIEGFFKPLAYALILLRQDGYPCPFYGDLYGLSEPHETPASCGGKLADLILARKLFAYGTQEDYFNEANCIGFVRRGTWDRKAGLACVMSNAGPGEIKMAVGEMHAGEKWTDVLGWEQDEVEIDSEGCGLFKCPGTSVAVWVRSDAEGRDRFPTNFDSDVYKA